MRCIAELRRSSSPRWVLLSAIAVSAAGCSADTARFNAGLFNAPPPQQQQASAAAPQPAYRVDSQPLPQIGAAPQPAQPASVAAMPPPVAPRTASYQPTYQVPAAPPRAADVTGTVPAGQGRWTWEGGTTVSAAPGDTGPLVARRYAVPATALAQVNGLAPNAALHPGQRIVIPRYQSSAPAHAAAHVPAAPRTAGGEHVVGPGDTLMRLSRLYGKSLSEIARANNIPPDTHLRIGDRIVIPGTRTAARPAPAAPSVLAPAPARIAAASPPPAPSPPPQRAPATAAQPFPKVASADTTSSVHMVAPEKAKAEPAANGASPPGFRWPVRGRVIAGFGPKPTGQQNDGIDLSVPEGTPVKASEDGVVAYAGNELKGYGNLVLVRHANGYVTAYAHASELLVKRGDNVKRGQVIAKSGQTGSVSSPQLHFEVRKGASPVDPMQFLTGAT
jgi:murein DD-endopeptidase MepM/ murein hydrolase activator NlpD